MLKKPTVSAMIFRVVFTIALLAMAALLIASATREDALAAKCFYNFISSSRHKREKLLKNIARRDIDITPLLCEFYDTHTEHLPEKRLDKVDKEWIAERMAELARCYAVSAKELLAEGKPEESLRLRRKSETIVSFLIERKVPDYETFIRSIPQ